QNINIFPPKDEIVTDENFGEQDNVVIQNLPGAQLRAEAEYCILSDEDTEDNLPLSNFVTKNKKKQEATNGKRTNNYANGKNLKKDVYHDLIRTFIGVLLLSSYVSVAQQERYWQNAPNTNNAFTLTDLVLL
ncbi:hypothetical protein ILUMI_09549, partial [Ignelater luminosus]